MQKCYKIFKNTMEWGGGTQEEILALSNIEPTLISDKTNYWMKPRSRFA